MRTVIIERADRLARDLMVQEVIIGQFVKIGVRILTFDGVDLTSADDDPTRRLIRQVLGAVAEFEKRILVLKLRAATRAEAQARGTRRGRQAYGYYPAEAAIVERMKQLRRKPRQGAPDVVQRHRRTVERGGPSQPIRSGMVHADGLPDAAGILTAGRGTAAAEAEPATVNHLSTPPDIVRLSASSSGQQNLAPRTPIALITVLCTVLRTAV